MELINVSTAQINQFKEKGFLLFQGILPQHLLESTSSTLKVMAEKHSNQSIFRTITVQTLLSHHLTTHIISQLLKTDRDKLTTPHKTIFNSNDTNEGDDWLAVNPSNALAAMYLLEDLTEENQIEILSGSEGKSTGGEASKTLETFNLEKHDTKDFEMITVTPPKGSLVCIQHNTLFRVAGDAKNPSPILGSVYQILK